MTPSSLSTFRKVLVPYDGSSASDRALELAVRIVSDTKANELVLMHVIPYFPTFPSSKGGKLNKPITYLNQVYRELSANADQKLQRLRKTHESKVPISSHIVMGRDVAREIIEYAGKHAIDLIVMGSKSTIGRGKSRLKSWIPLGTVSRAVSETAPCAVLLVRPV